MALVRTRVLMLAVGVTIAGSGGGRGLATSPPNREEAAVKAVMVGDMTLAVAPWIPCTGGKAAPLSQATVRAQEARVDALIARTYAAGEPTHAGIGVRLKATIAAYGVGGSATRAGDTLCDVGGGIDQARVQAFESAPMRARMTIQAHEWNETLGRRQGVAFHYKPQAVIRQTDEAILAHGQWRIARRGPMTFVTGAP